MLGNYFSWKVQCKCFIFGNEYFIDLLLIVKIHLVNDIGTYSHK